MPKVKRQEDIVRAHLELNGTITSMEAFERYHITRLAGIIYRLRKTMDIETITLHGHDQYGVYTQYAMYELKEPHGTRNTARLNEGERFEDIFPSDDITLPF